jgi:hypothetical protein
MTHQMQANCVIWFNLLLIWFIFFPTNKLNLNLNFCRK